MKTHRDYAAALLAACIARGYHEFSFEGEALAADQALALILDTEDPVLRTHNPDTGHAIVWLLTPGNAPDELVADYTVSEPAEAIWREVFRP